jgi:LysM repeat protein
MRSTEYRVCSGDTLSSIARRHKVPVDVLSRLNGIGDIHGLYAGQVLKIPGERQSTPRPPPRPSTYRVRAGETLSEVAQHHSVTVEALTQANDIKDPSRIAIGQVLKIPKERQSPPQGQASGTGTPRAQTTGSSSPSVPGSVPQRRAPFESGKEIGSFGRVSHDEGVNLRETPNGTLLRRLPFNTRVFVGRELPGDWYFVALDDGSFGYVAGQYVSIHPPEPWAVLHKIKKNEGALQIVKQYYKGNAISWGQDERYYVNVLVEANRGKKLAGIYKPTENANWSQTQTRENYLIWIPALDFARSLRGKVSSGSISHQAWEAVKNAFVAAAEFELAKVALTAGLIHGVLESLWDLLTGVLDLIKLVWDIIQSIFKSEFLSDLKGLWELVKSLSPSQLVDAGIKAFISRWNQPDFLRRWHFRGWVIGYAIAEILMAVFTGAAALVKWAGKAGKVGRLIAKMPKVVKLAERVAAASKRIPEDTIKQLKKLVSRPPGDGSPGKRLPEPPPAKSKDPAPDVVEVAAKQWLKRLERLKNRIALQADKFKLLYTEAELKAIVRQCEELGLSDRVIDDMIFAGSRVSKAISATDLMQQMKNWVRVVSKRGYPYRFKSLDEFRKFSDELLDGLSKAGVRTDDVRIQGSSLRNPNANDVDMAAFVDEAAFGELLVAHFHGKVAMNGQKLALKGKSYAELLELARDIGVNSEKYNAHARTLLNAMKTGIINSKGPIVAPLKELAASLASKYPHLNIETVSILLKGCLFDTTPDLPVKRH